MPVALQALGQLVPNAFQLAEGEQPRTAAGRHSPVEARARIGGAEEGGEVGLELGDLVEQRTASRALVNSERGDGGRPACHDLRYGNPLPLRVLSAGSYHRLKPRSAVSPRRSRGPPRR